MDLKGSAAMNIKQLLSFRFPAKSGADGGTQHGAPHGVDHGADTATRFLKAMPTIMRWTNMSVLQDRLTVGTKVVVVVHGLTTAAHLAHLALRSQGDRVFNDAGAFIAALVTWSYIVAALLQRRTIRRLHAEMLEFSLDVEAFSGPLPAALPARLRRQWVIQTVMPLCTWAFYTASPFLFEFIHDIPLGSLRRLSAMTYPTLCDLRGLACYRVMYLLVAVEWFWATVAFSSVESTNLVFYTLACTHFDVLGESIAQVYSARGQDGDDVVSDEASAIAAHLTLRRYTLNHQFLLRWSKEMTGVFAFVTFMRLGCMVLLFSLPMMKTLLVKNYVLDELPLVGMYGAVTIYIICWIADDLNRASAEVHDKAYFAKWEKARPELRRSLDIILMRTLRPVRTQAYLVNNLSLRTFLEVVNRSYSALQTIIAARRKGASLPEQTFD